MKIKICLLMVDSPKDKLQTLTVLMSLISLWHGTMGKGKRVIVNKATQIHSVTVFTAGR